MVNMKTSTFCVFATLVSLAPSLVCAQTSNAICEKTDTNSFLFYSYDESPCLVWARLQSLCLPEDRYINVPPLADKTWGYNPVTESETDSLCQCSVVAYALMAGCSWCQVGDAATWVTEERWRRDCTSYNNTSLSFAQIVLPLAPYVFQSWKDGRWDPIQAQAALTAGPANLSPTVASTTLFRSFPPHSAISRTANPSSTPTAGTDAPAEAAHSNAIRIGAIIGGVVGGLALLLAGIMTFRHWRKQNKFQVQAEKSMGPQGLPPYYDRHASGPAGGLFAMLTGGKDSQSPDTEEKSKKDRISRWSEGFFINPRKAPKPKNRYTTTSDRRRNKSLSSDTDGSSFVVLNSRRGSDGTLMSGRNENQGRSIQQDSGKHPFALSPGFESPSPPSAALISSRSSRTSPRKAVPIPPTPRMSFADRWSDQSSVFTFATSKTSRETLPSFSTSVKEIKGHRMALAKTVADREAAEKDREDRRWAKELAGHSTPDIILGERGKSGKKKGNKVREVDESGVKIKKRKKKKRSSNTPGYSVKRSSVNDISLPQSGTRQYSSIHSLAPSDMPEYANKPLPPPPNITRGVAGAASIDFSVAPPLTPGSAISPRSRSSLLPARAPLDTPGINRRQSDIDPFSRVETARMTVVTVDFPSPAAYASRPNSTLPLSVSRARKGRERSVKSRVVTADFTQYSPHPTLPSLYEPRTGAEVYDVPVIPRQPGGRIGNGEVVSETGSPVSRYPISTLQVREEMRI